MPGGRFFNGIDFKADDVLKVSPNDNDGNFSLAGLEDAITDKTKLIATMHISLTAGEMMTIEAIENTTEPWHTLLGGCLLKCSNVPFYVKSYRLRYAIGDQSQILKRLIVFVKNTR